MASPSLTLTFPRPDLAQITFDTPGKSANILSSSVLDELEAILNGLEKNRELAGLIILSGKPGVFIAGADLREFVAVMPTITEAETYRLCRRGQQLFARLGQAPFVTVAAIDGTCLGGGAELACWCDRRVMSTHERSEIGLPEVKLGLIPGWGGTARVPRIAGLSNAIELITGGEPLDAHSAFQCGLADDLVPGEGLLAAAQRMIDAERSSGQYLRDRERWSRPITIDPTELDYLSAAASATIQQQTKGAYPAPIAALELMIESSADPLDVACDKEAQRMGKLFGSPVNKALLNVFFLSDRIKRDSGVAGSGVTARTIAHVGIIGAGIMGSGIAAAHVKRGVATRLTDADENALAKGDRAVIDEVSYNKKAKGPDLQKALQAAPLLQCTQDVMELAHCDLVVEAVVENADVKRQVYSRLEPLLGEDALLASNTSTIPISSLASGLKRPDRFCGLHFFNPVRRMQLVEVIRGRETSDETVATLVAHAKRIGKLPIVVRDGPGFLVNRLLSPYMNEALHLLTEGVDLREIDRAARWFGMPMGPISLYDMVGIDTAFYAGRTMWEAFPDRVIASPILPALIRQQRLGQKSGKGFYSYQNRRGVGQTDPELSPLLEPYCQPPRTMPRETLVDRLILPMLLEATRALSEGLVRDPRDIDFGLIFGLGFPAYRGGLLFDLDKEGPQRLLERLQPYESLGSRYQPTSYLRQMADRGQRFYQ
jgi:3-hydroxyacyl-CoA dehydrogenase/enoyl-CoA hydratase/3-hydroxybutyryl-CoA epimerase/3-hydroxyacyl-CoA dehydrogenase/enoyl-CoA hydratase/3-hydroxybutyryl-CoA epimerase/enoyl-CoA isomerase